jgi:hypothetical protein
MRSNFGPLQTIDLFEWERYLLKSSGKIQAKTTPSHKNDLDLLVRGRKSAEWERYVLKIILLCWWQLLIQFFVLGAEALELSRSVGSCEELKIRPVERSSLPQEQGRTRKLAASKLFKQVSKELDPATTMEEMKSTDNVSVGRQPATRCSPSLRAAANDE